MGDNLFQIKITINPGIDHIRFVIINYIFDL